MPIKVITHEFVDFPSPVEWRFWNSCMAWNLTTFRPFDNTPLACAFGLVSGDVRDGSKDICAVCGRTADAISVVDTMLSGSMIDVKVLKVVVKVDRASTQVSAEEGRVWVVTSMCRFRQRGMTTLPSVEMHDNWLGKILNDERGRERKGNEAERASASVLRTQARHKCQWRQCPLETKG